MASFGDMAAMGAGAGLAGLTGGLSLPISALIGGGFSLAGGLMGQSAQQSQNAAQLAFATQSAEGDYLPNYAVNVRKAAEAGGFSPLAMLGQSANITPSFATGSPVGEAMSSIGQNLSRNIQMVTPHQERMDFLNEQQMQLRNEGANLNNALLRKDLINGPVPSPGGRVSIGTPGAASRVAKQMTGEDRLTFPWDLGAQGFDLFTGASNALFGPTISDWTGIPMHAKF